MLVAQSINPPAAAESPGQSKPTDQSEAILKDILDTMKRSETTLKDVLDAIYDSDVFQRTGKDVPYCFRSAYEHVAKQHDDKCLDRHSVLLILGGLFSAVSSAFIMNMESSLSPNPSDTTNSFLKILIKKVDNNTFPPQEAALPVWIGPSSTRIWIQMLACASLSTSLLAAFGAVLGKQWLGHSKTTRFGRGTLQERCQQRQRKLDGLDAWHFSTIIATLLIFFQLSLLFFGIALAANIWIQQHTVASVIMATTALGLIFCFFTALASLNSPDWVSTVLQSFRDAVRKKRKEHPESSAYFLDCLLVFVERMFGTLKHIIITFLAALRHTPRSMANDSDDDRGLEQSGAQSDTWGMQSVLCGAHELEKWQTQSDWRGPQQGQRGWGEHESEQWGAHEPEKWGQSDPRGIQWRWGEHESEQRRAQSVLWGGQSDPRGIQRRWEEYQSEQRGAHEPEKWGQSNLRGIQQRWGDHESEQRRAQPVQWGAYGSEQWGQSDQRGIQREWGEHESEQWEACESEKWGGQSDPRGIQQSSWGDHESEQWQAQSDSPGIQRWEEHESEQRETDESEQWGQSDPGVIQQRWGEDESDPGEIQQRWGEHDSEQQGVQSVRWRAHESEQWRTQSDQQEIQRRWGRHESEPQEWGEHGSEQREAHESQQRGQSDPRGIQRRWGAHQVEQRGAHGWEKWRQSDSQGIQRGWGEHESERRAQSVRWAAHKSEKWGGQSDPRGIQREWGIHDRVRAAGRNKVRYRYRSVNL